MKRINYFIAAIFLMGIAIGLTACIADLEEYNPSGSTADNVFSTEEGHTGLVNLCYSQLRAEFYGRENPLGLAMVGTDIWTESPSKQEYFPTGLYAAKLNSTNEGLMKNCWERFYVPINDCNAAIERAPRAMYRSEAMRAQRVAEAKFLRAFYYWHIVEQWGGVVLKMSETTTVVKTAERSSVHDFYKLCILKDLEDAVKDLPNEQRDHGRATKASAQGMLARMYLTYASYLKYFEGSAEALTYYQKAKDAADSVINDPGKYRVGLRLYNDVAEVFAIGNNKKTFDNAEAMFIVSHSTKDELNPQAAANRLPSYFISSYADKGMGVKITPEYGYADAIFLAPTKYLLQLFNEAKDARYSIFFREVWRCNDPDAKTADWTTNAINIFGKDPARFQAGPDVPPRLRTKLGFNVGDTAMWFTKRSLDSAYKAQVRYAVRDINNLYEEDGKLITLGSNCFYPQLLKYQDTIYATATTKNNAGKQDVFLMRLAEMYLIAAEAQFHISNNNADQVALDYINVLRKRAAIPLGSSNNDATSADVAAAYWGQGGYLNFILDERARELCGEHLRWFDLKRTKQLEHRLGAGKANPNVTEFKADRHYVRPIPISFLQSIDNGNAFGQNPHYD